MSFQPARVLHTTVAPTVQNTLEITDQTNLLALNAARADQQGRGLASELRDSVAKLRVRR